MTDVGEKLMIRISLGNVGSGKTACEVRNIKINQSRRKTYSNIIAKIKHCIPIKSGMIAKKIKTGTITRKSGKVETTYDVKLNLEYWTKIKEPINVVIDEAHSLMNARRSMSKANIILTDWIALLRRVLGENSQGYGELVLITQLPNRIDTIARDMATQVRFHKMWYKKTCDRCGYTWAENSEMPEPVWECPSCNGWKMKKHSFQVELWHFRNMEKYMLWSEMGEETYYKHYYIRGIEKYFGLYDTFQIDNLVSEIYDI